MYLSTKSSIYIASKSCLIQSFMFHTESFHTPYLNIKERIEEAEEEERLH